MSTTTCFVGNKNNISTFRLKKVTYPGLCKTLTFVDTNMDANSYAGSPTALPVHSYG